MVKMMWTSALALLVVVTLFGSSARAIKVCLYNDLKCNTEFACVDFDNGKCNSNKAFESTSAKCHGLAQMVLWEMLCSWLMKLTTAAESQLPMNR